MGEAGAASGGVEVGGGRNCFLPSFFFVLVLSLGWGHGDDGERNTTILEWCDRMIQVIIGV